MNPPRRYVLAASVAALLVVAPEAIAQTYPSRPVTMIVPASAGGPTDAIARVLSERMTANLGGTVLVDNVAGAGGSIGVGKVARSAPDGYTLGIGQWSHYVLNGATYALQYDLLADFAPISLIVTGPLLLVSRKDLPANDLKELIAWLKANPDKATAGTGGVGSPPHISGVFFQKMTGTQFQFVPYRGTAPAMRDLLAGQIDIMIDQASNVLPQLSAGTIKAFAVTSKERLPSAPDVPTVDEAGLPGLYVSVWHGLWAPKGTPADVIAKLNGAVVKSLAEPGTREKLAALGQDIPPADQLTPQALGAFQKAEIEKWWPIVKEAGIKAE
ncbi:MAG TPA: tripartite tricarboxylate transporter substrate-binding protein [Reyranella sp.]|jgi:tripartite-type tricarboxylate transporter receptor subunit TctC|nr:tripartite tricarboxylate transporter substrate-binding protein [Reyranella sp.]